MLLTIRLLSFSLIAPVLSGQAVTRLEFDAASLYKRTTPTDVSGIRSSPGRFRVINYTLSTLIILAYQVNDQDVMSLPEWARRDRFDIEAVFEAAPKISKQQEFSQNLARLRSLLEDKFDLRVHRETKVLPSYVLIVDKGIAKLTSSNSTVPGGMRETSGHLDATARDLDDLAGYLSRQLGRRVVDQTGLDGLYDFKLEFEVEGTYGDASPQSTEPIPATNGRGLPSLSTAVRTQLGLRLEAKQMPFKVVVVDRSAKPGGQ